MRQQVLDWIEKHVVAKREPDVFIGGRVNTYMRRWHVLPRNPIFNIYYHHFLRSDFAEALHDHPWLFNASWLLDGSYTEHVFEKPTHRGNRVRWYQPAMAARKVWRIGDDPPSELVEIGPTPEIEILEQLPKIAQHRVNAGAFKWRWGASPHRVELNKGQVQGMPSDYSGEQPVKTLFITGPKVRKWGFYCKRAWKHWKQFLAHYGSAHEGLDNKGCG